ncbi:hypothetical protein VNI00_001990 [Paramarasmius palmivorus]|uniref:Uncharacterized protein n=1 Tax=Paramarasmius palmivorus TaxID=297713 RepID=A0AAW0E0C1_9AGAR
MQIFISIRILLDNLTMFQPKFLSAITAAILLPAPAVFAGGFHFLIGSLTIAGGEPDIYSVLTDSRDYGCNGFLNSQTNLQWDNEDDKEFSGEVCGVNLNFFPPSGGGLEFFQSGGDGTRLGTCTDGDHSVHTCTSTGLDQAQFTDFYVCEAASLCN